MNHTKKSLEAYTEKEKWSAMNQSQRIRYILDYYKLPILLGCILLYVIGYRIYGHLTYKDTVLYTALINVAPGETVTTGLSDDFMTYLHMDTDKKQFCLYTGWYLTDDESSEYYEYTYASQMKILASIDDEQLDVVILNKEAFDAFAQNGYLWNLEEFLKGTELYEKVKPCLVNNLEILEDNAKDVSYDSSIAYESTTTEYPMGIDLSKVPLIADAGFEDTVYLAVIANTPRSETVLDYLQYLFES
jgi:hypothetical protein